MPFFRGRYRLSGKTYLGGSAIVKLGVDEKTNTMVAIKLHAKTGTFVKELKFLRLLRSEYVVPLIDHFEDEPPCLILKASYTYYGYAYPHGYTCCGCTTYYGYTYCRRASSPSRSCSSRAS